MNRVLWASVLCIAGLVGCNRGDGTQQGAEPQPIVIGDKHLVRPQPIIVEGCLTSAGDRFVLTELEPGKAGPKVAARDGERPWAENQPTTETFRLVGLEHELRPLVGQRVEISGEQEPEIVVDVRTISPPQPVRNERGLEPGQSPHVSTVQTARLEVHDLRVTSVRRSGGTCVASP